MLEKRRSAPQAQVPRERADPCSSMRQRWRWSSASAEPDSAMSMLIRESRPGESLALCPARRGVLAAATGKRGRIPDLACRFAEDMATGEARDRCVAAQDRTRPAPGTDHGGLPVCRRRHSRPGRLPAAIATVAPTATAAAAVVTAARARLWTITVAAVHRAVISRLERHACFFPAGGAGRAEHLARATASAGVRGSPCFAASGAAPRRIGKSPRLVEFLLTSSKREWGSAVRAGKCLVGEGHRRPPCR